jgi:hypothetical protein
MTDLTERLRLIAAWRTRGGPTPKQACPSVYETTTEAATTLETLTQENARLREALEGIVTGDVERVVAHVWRADGKPSKLDQCAHDVQINHDCPSCIEDHARKALGGGDANQA